MAPGRSKGKATPSWRSGAGAHRTVWTCGENDLRAGTGRLAGWLLNAVVKVVTTYTVPGDRVLLVEPAAGVRRSRGLGPYGGLLEAAWSVVRLGRGVRTYQVGEAGEGSGCAVDDRFDVVIVAAEPEVLASVRPALLAGVLAPHGLLAAITHSGSVDPGSFLVRTASENGLRYVDRIVLLQVPIDAIGVPGGLVHDADLAAAAVWARVHADLHVFSRVSR